MSLLYIVVIVIGILAFQTEPPCIGFSNLPEQLHRKAIKKGFDFTVMVVGMLRIPIVYCQCLSYVPLWVYHLITFHYCIFTTIQ